MKSITPETWRTALAALYTRRNALAQFKKDAEQGGDADEIAYWLHQLEKVETAIAEMERA